jgi:hypothetical protein
MGWSEVAAGPRFPAMPTILNETQEKLLDGDGATNAHRVERLTTFAWLVKIGVRGGAAR